MGGGPHRPGLSGGPGRPGLPSRPIVVVTGPTASGKSALALAIAGEFSGLVVNADSMQVYRELAILTARPGAEALAAVLHRLYGEVPAAERCSAGRWREMALSAIAAAPDRLPVVTGGTGLYLRALAEGLAPVPAIAPAVLAEGGRRLAELGAAGLHGELRRVDPVIAGRLLPSDSQRLLRAWCVWRGTGRSLAEWQSEAGNAGLGPVLTIALMPERRALYAACDARLLRMIERGAVEEVKALLALGLDPGLPAMKAVGVRELGAMLAGRASLEDAIAAAQQATRRYAKRQVTWLRHQVPGVHIVPEQYSERVLGPIFNIIRHFLLTLPD